MWLLLMPFGRPVGARIELDRRRLEHRAGRSHFLLRRHQPIVADRRRRGIGRAPAQHQDVGTRHVRQLGLHPLDLRQQALVDDQEPGPRLVDHPGQGLAAKARVDAEERVAGVGTAEEQRHQLEVVLEQHGDVTRRAVARGLEPAAQEVRRAHRLVAQLPIGPRPLVLHQEDLVLGHRVSDASLELGTDGERRIE
jgi:hypothetical protein